MSATPEREQAEALLAEAQKLSDNKNLAAGEVFQAVLKAREAAVGVMQRTQAACDLLTWNDVYPDVRMVEENTTAATRTWMVVADYGWAERILCSGCYETDAESIVAAIKACRP